MSNHPPPKILNNAVSENFKWLDKILTSGVILSITILLAKIFGTTHVEIFKIDIPLSYSWVIGLIFSIAHLYTAKLTVSAIEKVWLYSKKEEREEIYYSVTSIGGVFLRGLLPRRGYYDSNVGFKIYKMNPKDPTTWLSYISITIFMFAIMPFNAQYRIWDFTLILTAIFLGGINILIGTKWATALSYLPVDKKDVQRLPIDIFHAWDDIPFSIHLDFFGGGSMVIDLEWNVLHIWLLPFVVLWLLWWLAIASIILIYMLFKLIINLTKSFVNLFKYIIDVPNKIKKIVKSLVS